MIMTNGHDGNPQYHSILITMTITFADQCHFTLLTKQKQQTCSLSSDWIRLSSVKQQLQGVPEKSYSNSAFNFRSYGSFMQIIYT